MRWWAWRWIAVGCVAGACGQRARSVTAPPAEPAEPPADATPAEALDDLDRPTLDWLVDLGTPHAHASALAVDSRDDVLAAGLYAGTPWTDEFPLSSTNGEPDALVVKLAADDGRVLWRAGYGDAGLESATAIAVDSDDDVYIAGSRSEVVGTTRKRGAFVVKLSGATGDLVWEQRVEGGGQVDHMSLGVAGDRVIAFGGFSDRVAIGEHGVTPGHRGELILVSLSRRDGPPGELLNLGFPRSTGPYGVAGRASGAPAVLVKFSGVARDIRVGALSDDWVIASVDPSGSVVEVHKLVEAKGRHLQTLARNGDTFATSAVGRARGPTGLVPYSTWRIAVLFWDRDGDLVSTYEAKSSEGYISGIAPWGAASFLAAQVTWTDSDDRSLELVVLDPTDGAVWSRDVYVEKLMARPALAMGAGADTAALTWMFSGVTGVTGTYVETEPDETRSTIAKFSGAVQ